jgi:hypothetical protein
MAEQLSLFKIEPKIYGAWQPMQYEPVLSRDIEAGKRSLEMILKSSKLSQDRLRRKSRRQQD